MCRWPQQFRHAYQICYRRAVRKHKAHFLETSHFCLPSATMLLLIAKVRLDQFANGLEYAVTHMPGGATVDGATAGGRGVLRNMRRDTLFAAGSDKAVRVVTLVRAHGAGGELIFEHVVGGAGGLGEPHIDC